MGQDKPLTGVRVLEWSTFVAAPVCGRVLADWGAEVVKVEMPDGDYWRTYGEKMEVPASPEENPLFDVANANKRGIVLDLRSPRGRELMERLLERTDVLITNTRPRVLKKLGLDYDSLKARFPRLIFASVTGYGDRGPESYRPGYDAVTYWAYGGFMADMRLADSGQMPVHIPLAAADIGAGTMLFGAVTAALYARERTGRGDKVTVSLYGEAVWTMGMMNTIAQPGYDYRYPRARADAKPSAAVYRCKDGEWIVVAAVQYERDFPRLCACLGVPELAHEPAYRDTDTMMLDENRIPLRRLFEQKFLEKTAREWSAVFDEADLVHDRLVHYRDISRNQQARENHFIEEVTFPSGNRAWLPRPCMFSENLGTPEYRRGPLLGEDTCAVLGALGLPPEEVETLEREGVVRTARKM